MVNKRSKATSMRVGRDPKTGRFISAKKAHAAASHEGSGPRCEKIDPDEEEIEVGVLGSCGHMACDRMGEAGGLIVLRQAPSRFWLSALGYAGGPTSVKNAISPTRGIVTGAPDLRVCSPAAPVVHHTRVP